MSSDFRRKRPIATSKNASCSLYIEQKHQGWRNSLNTEKISDKKLLELTSMHCTRARTCEESR